MKKLAVLHFFKPALLSVLVLLLVSGSAHAQHRQTVVVDIFTNSHCSPCATMHAAVDASIKGTALEQDVIIIYHHVRTYSDDPIYQENTTEPTLRGSYLGGVSGTPTVFFNGTRWTASYSGWTAYLSSESAMQTEYEVVGTLNTTADSATVTCTVSRNQTSSTDVNLYSVLVENVTYKGRNNVSDHNGAMRIGFTAAAGIPLTFDDNGQATVVLSAPIKSTWDATKLRAVFVIQDPATKKPLQAYQAPSNQPTSVLSNVNSPSFTTLGMCDKDILNLH
ncbi:MAG: hypothetical protein HQ472_07880 [Ignavibacteria bacterium]|nr:hypothetical protein [Ignavibacteria bacterium]